MLRSVIKHRFDTTQVGLVAEIGGDRFDRAAGLFGQAARKRRAVPHCGQRV